ncbi:MAG: HDIG domain-containing protein [Synergistaceae bacterium]|nr:HDIG domain-containing protein [Synergistaceae bacterium]
MMKKHDRKPRKRFQSPFLSSGFLVPLLILMAAGTALLLVQWAILSSDEDSFTVGAPSPQTYRVIEPMRYEDQAVTAALREMASGSIVGVTVRDLSAKTRLRKRLEALRAVDELPRETLVAYVPGPLLDALSGMGERERTRLLALTEQVGEAYIDRLEAEGENVDSGKEASLLWEEIGNKVPSVDDANLVYQVLAKLGDLNFRVDSELTERVRRTAADDIPAIERRLEVGDVIIERGETVSPQVARLLRLQGYMENVFPIRHLCVILVLSLFLPLWLNMVGRDAGERRPSWGCVAFLVLVAWFFEALAAMFHLAGAGMVPAVLASCLCSQGAFAFNAALTGTVTGVFAVLNPTFYDFTLMLVLAVFAATLGGHLLNNPESRTQINRRVFLLTALLTGGRLLLRWLQGGTLVSEFFHLLAPGWALWAEYGFYFLFELTGAHLVSMLLPAVEESLGVLSVLRLRELSHPSSPLLRTLQREAPGTYQHCLTIATLIEAVAADMGMDVNLVRAGAYYHDIGKLRRPQFYVENQQGGPNAHDEMSPSLSAITIISHVNEGLQMAWDAKLPKRIRDFIAEHHGTTCVRYFYNKAKAAGEKADRGRSATVEWSDFCYPGPKPRSRETALLMIVDSTEAAVRSMNLGRKLVSEDEPEGADEGGHPNRGRSRNILALRQVVDQVVSSKAGEDQFSEVNFTQKDLAQVKESLLNALLSLYHTRRVKKIEEKGQK